MSTRPTTDPAVAATDSAAGRAPLATGVQDHWDELLTVALLGTDRRDPPEPLAGPVADVVADTVRNDPARRLLADVAATAVLRRAAFLPGPPVDQLLPPAPDPRPPCPPSAVATWRYVSAEWPVLLDEFVLAVLHGGWRLPADVAVAMLRSRRTDAVRRPWVERAAGPVAAWLVDHVPSLGSGQQRSAVGGAPAVDVFPGAGLPDLAVPPDLQSLLVAEAQAFLGRALPEFDHGRVGPAHRAVWVNVLARCRPDVLAPVAAALEAVNPSSPSAGIAHVLADLARTRRRMLAELVVHDETNAASPGESSRGDG